MTEHTPELADQLAPYIDGELDAADAEPFALHLADCPICRAALHDALQLAALETRAQGGPVREAAPRARERAQRWSRRSKLVLGGAAVAAAAAVILVIATHGGAIVGEPAPVLATADVRTVEGRVSYAAADRYRRYSVARAAGPVAHDAIPLDTLAKLERGGDLHGVAAGYLLLGDPARATAYLERAAGSPDVAADRAFVLLSTGHPADALVALDRVLESSPRHPQALWNRALALRDLGLVRMAAAAFEAVAALGEPGWADEARARAKALTDEANARQGRSERVIGAGIHLANAPGGISPDDAQQIPGTARVLFDDAVRSAASPDAVRALAPLARALDEVAAASGRETRLGYVERIAASEFRVRGPLAAQYAEIVAEHPLAPEAAGKFVAALRAARQDDLLFGALIQATPDGRTAAPADLTELGKLAEATGDPWYRMIAIEQQALARIAGGEAAAVELLVLPALAACSSARLDLWCGRLELALGQSYLIAQRLADARRVLGDGIARARRSGEWLLEQRFYPELANLEMLSDDVSVETLPLARGYLGELVRRDPRCATEVWTREQLATALTEQQDIAGARGELAKADSLISRCPDAKPIVRSVVVKAAVARDDQVAAVRAEIAALRGAQSTTPAEQPMLDQIEGALLLDRDHPAAVALLERAIAGSLARAPSDVDRRKARAYAYSSLIFDAGRAGDWARAWRLFGEQSGAALERCGLAVATDAHTRVVVLRDASGGITGLYEGARAISELDAAHVVPPRLVDQLRGCAEVEVIARPPIEGSPAVLPPELAWSYRSGASAPTASAGPDRRLVIANVEPPRALGLPRLMPWRSEAPPDVMLEGVAATPPRVLAALADAGTIEIHAHGMINSEVSDASVLMLSPDPDGRYALTAAEIRNQPLRRSPLVILAACHAASAPRYRHELWGLPVAFLAAGARAVIASADVVADDSAGEFFDTVRARIDRVGSVSRALRDVRLEWLAAHPQAVWVRSLMVFR